MEIFRNTLAIITTTTHIFFSVNEMLFNMCYDLITFDNLLGKHFALPHFATNAIFALTFACIDRLDVEDSTVIQSPFVRLGIFCVYLLSAY